MNRGLPSSIVKKHNRKRPKSSIEKLVGAWLEADGIPYKAEAKIGKCHVDVLLNKRFIVELNGCYWHGCHRCFPKKSNKQRLKRFKDIRRYQYLGRKGYRVLVLWECDILGKPDESRQKLIQYYVHAN